MLLRGPSTLTRGERELIAAYVSALNECRYCAASHAASAAAQLPDGMALVEQVCVDAGAAQVSAKMKALLAIAAAVQHSGLSVTAGQVDAARAAEATDLQIHDTVLTAAAFCMMNRYVDGLATIAPDDPAVYAAGAQRLIRAVCHVGGAVNSHSDGSFASVIAAAKTSERSEHRSRESSQPPSSRPRSRKRARLTAGHRPGRALVMKMRAPSAVQHHSGFARLP